MKLAILAGSSQFFYLTYCVPVGSLNLIDSEIEWEEGYWYPDRQSEAERIMLFSKKGVSLAFLIGMLMGSEIQSFAIDLKVNRVNLLNRARTQLDDYIIGKLPERIQKAGGQDLKVQALQRAQVAILAVRQAKTAYQTLLLQQRAEKMAQPLLISRDESRRLDERQSQDRQRAEQRIAELEVAADPLRVEAANFSHRFKIRAAISAIKALQSPTAPSEVSIAPRVAQLSPEGGEGAPLLLPRAQALKARAVLGELAVRQEKVAEFIEKTLGRPSNPVTRTENLKEGIALLKRQLERVAALEKESGSSPAVVGHALSQSRLVFEQALRNFRRERFGAQLLRDQAELNQLKQRAHRIPNPNPNQKKFLEARIARLQNALKTLQPEGAGAFPGVSDRRESAAAAGGAGAGVGLSPTEGRGAMGTGLK